MADAVRVGGSVPRADGVRVCVREGPVSVPVGVGGRKPVPVAEADRVGAAEDVAG